MLLGMFSAEGAWVVWFLMLVLLLMSVLSWAIILGNVWFLRQAQQAHLVFESAFWSGVDLAGFYDELTAKSSRNTTEEIFSAGFSALLTHRAQVYNAEDRVSQCKQMMALVPRKWALRVQGQLTWLATVASVSPYVGLLGTVFGVMHTFQGIMGSQASSQLSAVAPGISEALGMTAFGLFVAIPATVAYNRLSLKLESLLEQFQIFQDEFIVLIKKQRAI